MRSSSRSALDRPATKPMSLRQAMTMSRTDAGSRFIDHPGRPPNVIAANPVLTGLDVPLGDDFDFPPEQRGEPPTSSYGSANSRKAQRPNPPWLFTAGIRTAQC